MRPTLFSIGELHFHSYTIALALAFLIGVLLPVRRNYQLAQPYPITPIGGIWVFIGALIGAKVYWHVQYGDGGLLRVFQFWEGGLVFYGGLFGGVAGALAYLRLVGAPVLPVGDLTMPYVPLAHGAARVGCFLNGCCWGTETGLPWGVAYPRASLPYAHQLKAGSLAAGSEHALPIHPVQLYESLGLLCLFFALRYGPWRRLPVGAMIPLYFLGYGVVRFGIEFFRGDSAHPLLGQLTASQGVALAFVAGGLAGFAVLKARAERALAVPERGVAEGE